MGQNEENNYSEEINELTDKIKELESEEKKIDDLIGQVIKIFKIGTRYDQ